MSVVLVQGNALHLPLADASVDCVCTSPPYFNLRDYGTGQWVGGEAACTHRKDFVAHHDTRSTLVGTTTTQNHSQESWGDQCRRCGAVRVDHQIGLEKQADCLAWARQEPPCAGGCWVCAMRVVFAEVWRIMTPEATLWLNVGDSYVGGNQGGTYNPATWKPLDDSGGNATWTTRQQRTSLHMAHATRLPPKSLTGLPWRLALALQADGFILRSDCIWEKPSCMPESVTDRFTRSHEYVFLFAKQARYYFDAHAIREPAADWGLRDRAMAKHNTEGFRANGQPPHHGLENGNWASHGRNPRTVWTIASESFAGAHYATFPTALVRKCLLAGCPRTVCTQCGRAWVRQVERSLSGRQGPVASGWRETGRRGEFQAVTRMGWSQSTTLGFTPTCPCTAPTRAGIALDPFVGSGTVLQVARELGLHGVGVDLSWPYLHTIARERLGLAALQKWQQGDTPHQEDVRDLPLFAGGR